MQLIKYKFFLTCSKLNRTSASLEKAEYMEAYAKTVSPVVTYPNADIDKINILAYNRGIVCVYRWINKINGNTYIGSSINLSVRMYKYYNLASLVIEL